FRLGELFLQRVHRDQVLKDLYRAGVVRPQDLLSDRPASSQQRLGLGIAGLVNVESPQTVEAAGHFGMVLPQSLLAYSQRAAIQRLGGRGLILPAMEASQIVHNDGDMEGFRTPHALVKG